MINVAVNETKPGMSAGKVFKPWTFWNHALCTTVKDNRYRAILFIIIGFMLLQFTINLKFSSHTKVSVSTVPLGNLSQNIRHHTENSKYVKEKNETRTAGLFTSSQDTVDDAVSKTSRSGSDKQNVQEASRAPWPPSLPQSEQIYTQYTYPKSSTGKIVFQSNEETEYPADLHNEANFGDDAGLTYTQSRHSSWSSLIPVQYLINDINVTNKSAEQNMCPLIPQHLGMYYVYRM